MKISVVIPAYNEEKYLEPCLNSLKKQVVPPDEIIVVDNNSSDNTAAIAKKFNLKLIKETKQGITHARNTGFDSAQYEIIARCDADTILPPTWIKRIKADFGKKKKPDALLGLIEFYDLDTMTVFQPQFVTMVYKIYLKTMKKLLKHYPLNGPNMVITKEIWKKVRNKVCLDDSKVHEDIDLSIHIHQAGGKISYDDKLLVKFSARRIKNKPDSFFVEYPERVINTIKLHYDLSLESKMLILNAKVFFQGVHKMYSFLTSSKAVVSAIKDLD